MEKPKASKASDVFVACYLYYMMGLFEQHDINITYKSKPLPHGTTVSQQRLCWSQC